MESFSGIPSIVKINNNNNNKIDCVTSTYSEYSLKSSLESIEMDIKSDWKQIDGNFINEYVFDRKIRFLNIFNKMNEYEVFENFFDNNIIRIITEESNSYLQSYLSNKSKNGEIIRKEEKIYIDKITNENIRKYIGLIYLMGIIELPHERMYWSNDTLYHNNLFPTVMSGNLFRFLNKFLHFPKNDFKNENNRFDKLYKIQPFIDVLREKWRKNKPLLDIVTIDETMIKWTGRLSIKQYIPLKPVKYGIKVFSIADALTGYVIDWEVYKGKDSDTNSIIKSLINNNNIRECHVFSDSFFMNVEFIEFMKLNGNYVTGTVKKNKYGFPKVDALVVKKKDKPIFFEKNEIIYSTFYDKRVVRIASTFYSSSIMKKIKYNKKTKRQEEIYQPLMVSEYNKFARGVDRNNQLVSYYCIEKKSKKWYKKIFYYALELTLINSFIVYKNSSNSNISLLDYKGIIIKKLLGVSELQFKNSEKSTLRMVSQYQHFLKEIENNKRRDCIVCSDRNIRRQMTYFECDTCNKAYCLNCFKNYHKNS